MKFQWGKEKAEANFRKHGVNFESVTEFDFTTAMVGVDDRFQYGETRLVAVGLIGFRVHVLVYTERGETVRVISLRKANAREIRKYVEYTEEGQAPEGDLES
jgi:uncharacterized protein